MKNQGGSMKKMILALLVLVAAPTFTAHASVEGKVSAQVKTDARDITKYFVNAIEADVDLAFAEHSFVSDSVLETIVAKRHTEYVQLMDKKSLKVKQALGGEWWLKQAKNAFDYKEQIRLVVKAFHVIAEARRDSQTFCAGPDAHADLVEAVESLAAVTGEIIGVIVCISSNAGIVAFPVCSGIGYIVGAVIGNPIGEYVYSKTCE